MKAFRDGEIVDEPSVTVHLNCVSCALGTLVFEGLRCYERDGPDGGLYAFRLADHFRRLVASLRCLNVDPPCTLETLRSALVDLVAANGRISSCYVKIMVFWDHVLAGTSLFDLSRLQPKMAIFMRPAPAEFFSTCQDLRCCVSSWRRISSDSAPPGAKASANYYNARLALVDAMRQGYDNAILLNHLGEVAEATESNLFLVFAADCTVVTPSLHSGILAGVTRDTIMASLPDVMSFRFKERAVRREEVYSADQLFLTNTASLVRRVSEVDGRTFRDSPVVPEIRRNLLALLSQRAPAPPGWFDQVG